MDLHLPVDAMISGRSLSRAEVQRLWEIDRSETIERAYRVEGSELVPHPARFELQGWPRGEAERYTPILEACFDRGGWFHALFAGAALVAAAVLDGDLVGRGRDLLPLTFLHVGRAHRGQGLGRRLFDLAATEAGRRGATSLYISATPSERTIAFYLGLGCRLAPEPDATLLEREPEDVHLVRDLAHVRGGVGWQR